ncbi:MAG: hypothetical protein U1E49_08680 [Hyphomicrobiaceae bacterium]
MLRIEDEPHLRQLRVLDETDPFEAGIGFTVPKSKRRISWARPHSPAVASSVRKLVRLEIEARDGVSHGDCVHAGRAQVSCHLTLPGRQRSKARSLARVDVTAAGIGTRLEIGKLDGHQKRLPATVVRVPHYDPDQTRVRS